MDYRVELDVYNGPLDLLLYLLKRDELDIYDIPIHSITETYMQYVTMLRGLNGAGLDINIAGEFLVMAATLMEIKSATLLPRVEAPSDPTAGPTAAEQLADPRFELVQKLLEYKRFKDNAALLEQHQREHEARFPRVPANLDGTDEPPPLDLEEVQIWDLLDAFSRLMKEVGVRKLTHDVTYDDTPIDLHAADIEDRLKREPRLTLRDLIVGRASRSEMIGVFLALLELIREKKILVTQGDTETGDAEIVVAPEEHRKTFVGASLHLSEEPAEDETQQSELATDGTQMSND